QPDSLHFAIWPPAALRDFNSAYVGCGLDFGRSAISAQCPDCPEGGLPDLRTIPAANTSRTPPSRPRAAAMACARAPSPSVWLAAQLHRHFVRDDALYMLLRVGRLLSTLRCCHASIESFDEIGVAKHFHNGGLF